MSPASRERAAEFLARGFVGFLFVLLTLNVLDEFMRTRHVTGLLLLISEGLVVVLTIVRRPAQAIDRSMAARLVTGVSVIGPILMRAANGPGLLVDEITALISIAGLCLVISGKYTLGRSFGLAPANRGVVAKGPYLIVRHPIYTGYLISHVAFLAAHPSPWNLTIVLIADGALIVRALFEERVLGRDEQYRQYCQRVGWHLVPGVF
jgi:protein-S-isoprenylcysteine O-methyltransferase Ste14